MTDMSEPFLHIQHLTRRFGPTVALDDVSLDVGTDELLVVLGPTGAGKTTLLRTVAGLENPSSGTIRLNGQDVTPLAPAARDVALVFQNFSLYPDRSVRQNIEFPLRAPGRKLLPEQIRERVEWAASVLRITHLLDRPSTRLSGGEMQRVAIGRAIVRRPRLFLMDEPLTNLDAKLRESLRVELVALRRALKTPMVYVTHDQAEALSMGDRIVVLSGGRVLQTGTPQDVYCKPATPEVARQLGQPAINLFNVTRGAGGWMVASGAVILASIESTAQRATLGVRPEDVSLTGGLTPGRIKMVEDMGPTLTVLLHWHEQDVHAVVKKGTPVRVGDEVWPSVVGSRAVVWGSA